MNELERKAAEVQLGVLKLQHILLKSQLKGALPGHPFYGNQWTGGGGGGMMAPDRDMGTGVATGSSSSSLEKVNAIRDRARNLSKVANDLSAEANRNRGLNLSHEAAADAHEEAGNAHYEAAHAIRSLPKGNPKAAANHEAAGKRHRDMADSHARSAGFRDYGDYDQGRREARW